MRTLLLSTFLVLGLGLTSSQSAEPTKLFDGKTFNGWDYFLAPSKDGKKVEMKDVWTVEDGYIKCVGRPLGYLITKDEFSDYELRLKWRWVKGSKGGNSGVLLHVVGDNKIWPKSIEAQLASGSAGDFWLIDKPQVEIDPKQQDPKVERHYFRIVKEAVEKEIGEWNEYVITCKGDTIKLEINGKVVNEAKKVVQNKGKIALQSEGAEIHFKDIEIRSLK
ncbi:MAG: DUF1080 domain-containing protein [Gemmataceae bacterium]|nr:DUF1080 domain-containing protein [Gemmataceae bacterium]